MRTLRLIRRVLEGKIPFKLACSLWWEWWLPHRMVAWICGKLISKYLVWRDRSYMLRASKHSPSIKGKVATLAKSDPVVDEFHSSLNMNLQAMLAMNKKAI
jgi:hypothetical protein